MASKEQADYESLVRQQLTELGYNSEAIPDAVGFCARTSKASFHVPLRCLSSCIIF